jgi:hypothetical protein
MTISDFFLPNRQLVSSISRANPGVVTTTAAHGYLTGLFVRFFFPLDVGMNLLNNQVVEITVIDPTSFSIGVDTTNFDSYAAVTTDQLAQVIPVGSDALSVLQPVENSGNIDPEF